MCCALCVSCIAEHDLGDRPSGDALPDRIGGRIDWQEPQSSGSGGAGPSIPDDELECTGCPDGMVRVGSPPEVDQSVQPGGYYCAHHAAPPPRAPDCGASHELCGDACVDVTSHPDHCGGCDVSCPTPGLGHRLCEQGACAPCGTGFFKCGASGGTLCVDPSTDRDHCGACGSPCEGVCQDGACVSAEGFTLLANLVSDDFAIDGAHVFANDDAMGGRIVRITETGGFATTIASGARAMRIATDATHVYWSDADTGGLYRAAKSGGGVELVAQGARPFGIALHDDYLYWADEGTVSPVPLLAGSIQRVGKSGGQAEVLLQLVGASCREIAVDDEHVYFTHVSGASGAESLLSRMPLDGGEPEVMGQSAFIGTAASGELLYGIQDESGTSVVKAQMTGGATSLQSVAQIATSGPNPVAVGASELYFYFGSYRSPKCGGAIGHFLPTATRIKAAGGHVYWVSGERLFRRAE